jgi:DNA-binding MarR family transcriptional regulator
MAKAGERFAVLNAFVDFALAGLTRAEIAVWLVLYRDTRDGTSRTSYGDLARRVGINRRNVGRALRRLEARGLLTVVHRGELGRGVSRYHVRGLPKGG